MRELYLGTEVVRQAVAAQEKVIRKIADNGACVIVGRAADYVLREYPNAVRVFHYAPMEYRVKKVSEMYGDTPAEAQRQIKRSDAARARMRDVVERAIDANSPDPADPIDVRSKVGGFDIAAMCGFYLGAAASKAPARLDGVISCTAALCAARL